MRSSSQKFCDIAIAILLYIWGHQGLWYMICPRLHTSNSFLHWYIWCFHRERNLQRLRWEWELTDTFFTLLIGNIDSLNLDTWKMCLLRNNNSMRNYMIPYLKWIEQRNPHTNGLILSIQKQPIYFEYMRKVTILCTHY